LILLLPLLLSGCDLFGGAADTPGADAEPSVHIVPTFTATPVPPPQAPTETPTPKVAAAAPPLSATAAISVATVITPTATTPIIATEAQTPSAASREPRLTIIADAVNIRGGPGTNFDLMGSATEGQSFTILAKNAAGDWWQICCIGDQPGWIFGELAAVENADAVAVAADLPTPAAVAPAAPTTAPAAAAPEANTPSPVAEALAAPAAPPDPAASSAGYFDPNAAYQIVHFKVLGLDENNGGIRDSRAQHHIFITVLDQAGNGVDGAVVKNLVGDKSEVVTGGKGPGKAEITMYYEPFKLTVASDPSGPTTSQVSNQMGVIFPHLPDIVGKLGDVNYEYGACPTLEIKCQWPIHGLHFSYEITFQKVT
jgi:uncharacterized protein YraI